MTRSLFVEWLWIMYSRGEAANSSLTASLADFRSSADLIQRTSPLGSTLKMSNGGSIERYRNLTQWLSDPQVAQRPGSEQVAALFRIVQVEGPAGHDAGASAGLSSRKFDAADSRRKTLRPKAAATRGDRLDG